MKLIKNPINSISISSNWSNSIAFNGRKSMRIKQMNNSLKNTILLVLLLVNTPFMRIDISIKEKNKEKNT